ncbi:hypothetical protein [Actinokineospora sp. HUAS TT18]|uniref:hypothetical protein n=1 Tax=Actinokineospora sp. HUAS TT18 TaxID=3447451 RepID=UPI003F51F3BE
MERALVDGVPVLWAEGPAPLTATLVFGCGARDETFRTIGVTHLIEHLAMSVLPRVHYEHNASVESETTEFYATGKPEQIVSFLDTICRAFGALPLDRIAKEAGVLAAEGGATTHPTSGALMTRRFGLRSHGLAPWDGPGYDRLTEDIVTEYAARFFTAGNAVLTLTGPPPEGLRLPLPAGGRPVREVVEPLSADGPYWSDELVPSAGLSMLGRIGSTADTIGLSVLEERLLQTARREQGISYEVSGDQADIDADRAERYVILDAREGQEAEAATVLWNTAKELALHGPTEEELAHERESFAEFMADPRSVSAALDHSARSELFGLRHRTLETLRDEIAATTAADVTAAMAAALRVALLVVPQEVKVDLTDLDGKPVPFGGCPRTREVPEGRVFKPGMLARAVNKEARKARLVLTDDGIAFLDGEGEVHFSRFTDVVGVEHQGESRVVFTKGACVIPVDPELFSGVGPAVQAVDAKVPAHLRYPASDLA